jgi:hypothetical protein
MQEKMTILCMTQEIMCNINFFIHINVNWFIVILEFKYILNKLHWWVCVCTFGLCFVILKFLVDLNVWISGKYRYLNNLKNGKIFQWNVYNHAKCFLYARKNFGHIMLYPLASVRLSVRLSVRPSVRPLAIWFPEHNLSSIWTEIFKLHRMIVHIG